MSEKPNFLLVSAQVLPEVFLKVVEAKMLLAQGKAKSSSQAAKLAGISRSAFYKYKDSVYLYDERMSESLVTFSLTLEDRPGVLSSTLTELYKAGANIITVNQNIPVDGVAIVSISARIGNASCSRLEILEMLGNLDGIVEAKTI
ncbi:MULTISPECIES: ACT domain-containing protein [Anaerotruncus]|uniref:ACT domain-containing protein n=1 Tax=Anaerotruncus TaxID=244127 RepID=UPI00082CE3F7|nr:MULTISPECIES: ACT domain-containing protein [Anaerotruncus]RGX55501.1 ACT domain-containing protein [Anaerotruncus sp. AF02-27]